jgi:hypothetical protein
MLYYKELNNFYKLLEVEVINNNGIFYGTYPCERLLASYYEKKYNNLPIHKFYDINYNKETIDRFIKSTNIKIAFKHGNDHINFYSFINNNTNIINSLNINIEITISNDEPPYKHNNYSCYGLLLSKINDKIEFHYSKNTGTLYDNIENATNIIIKDIIQKKTNYIRGFISNYEIFNDIYKMIDNGWKIKNLPYNVYYNDKDENCCPICLDTLNNTEIASIYEYHKQFHNYKLHHKCLIKFLATQKNKEYFKCPYRYKIDFRICHLSMIL